MALHDVGGEVKSFDRNHSPLNAGSTWINPVVDGNTNNVPQILIGSQTDGFGVGRNYGIKVAQQGIDVRDASSDQLVMSSAFNNFKIIATGSITVTRNAASPSGSSSLYVTSLGGTGIVAFAKIPGANPNTSYQTPIIAVNNTTGIVNEYTVISYDSSTGYTTFSIFAPSSGAAYGGESTYIFKYYILVESIV